MPTKKANHRRGNKEGSIYKRKDGKWSGQVLLGYNELGKPIRKTYYGTTREEVAQKVNGAVYQVFSGTIQPNARKVHVKEMLEEYLWTFKKPAVADVTFDWYRGICDNHITPNIGNLVINEMASADIQTLLNMLHGQKKLSQRAVKAVRDLLNQAFSHALEVNLVERNPVTGTKIPKVPRAKGDDDNAKVITVADRTKILAATDGDLRMKTALTVLMFTGMRIGEFLALTWGNVDFRNGVITIDRALTSKCEYDDEHNLTSRTTIVGATKTQCGTRKIKVSPIVTDVLKEWREALPNHLRSPVEHNVLAPSTVVFPNDLGQMRTYYGFRTTYRRFMTEKQLPPYTLHSYRHTFATMLLETGTNPRVVQKLLGHADIETTLGIYSHVLPEVFDGVADTLTGVYTEMTKKGAKNTVST
ncbi:MAG: site-specific integrase [Oscillospiraceae bacterium]|jgi:integrase|nr:site-specific integrase [Oscillospiraceae bacterium]